MVFCVPYEVCGLSSIDSGTTSGNAPPNTATELANTNRGGCGNARQASSRLRVASRLIRMPSSKSASACPLTIAARWKTVFVSAPNALCITAGSAMSPATLRMRLSSIRAEGITSSSTSSSIGSGWPDAPVSCPRSSNASASRIPRKPAPPVMTTFTRNSSTDVARSRSHYSFTAPVIPDT